MPVTIKQIAEASGFSVPTVSQVLNNKGHLYRPETRQRVLDVARELGYRPNSYRWALRTGRFNNLGLLIPAHPAAGLATVADGWAALARIVARRDMHLTVGALGEIDPEDPTTTPKMLREWSVDGLVIACGSALPADLRQLIEDHKIPAIDVGMPRPRDCVYGDDAAGFETVLQELADLGHARLAYFDTAGEDRPCSRARHEALKKVVQKRGDAVQIVCHDTAASPDDRFAAASALLDGEDRPTAVLAGSEADALTLLQAAARLGLTVPGDLSLVAIASRPIDAAGVVMDRLGSDAVTLFEAAAEMLLRRIEHPSKTLPPKKIALARHPGQTVASAN